MTMQFDDLFTTQPSTSEPEVKTIFVLIAGGGEGEDNYRSIQITPTTTALDILSQLELRGFELEKPDRRVYAFDEDVFAQVVIHQKLYAVKASVSGGQQYAPPGVELKEIFVLVAGGGDQEENYHKVKLAPGTSVIDVLTFLNLRGFQLENPDGSVYAADDDLYEAVTHHQKVYASKDNVKAGAGSGYRS